MRSLAVFVDAVCGHHMLPWIYLHRLMPLNISDSLNSDREGSLSWSLLSAVFLSVDTRWYKNWDHTSPHPYLYEQQLVVFLGPSWFQWPQGHQGLHDPRCALCTFFFLRCSNDEFMIWWAYNASFAVRCACCRRWFHTWEWHWLETRSLYCWSITSGDCLGVLSVQVGATKFLSWVNPADLLCTQLLCLLWSSLRWHHCLPRWQVHLWCKVSRWEFQAETHRSWNLVHGQRWTQHDPSRHQSMDVYGSGSRLLQMTNKGVWYLKFCVCLFWNSLARLILI